MRIRGEGGGSGRRTREEDQRRIREEDQRSTRGPEVLRERGGVPLVDHVLRKKGLKTPRGRVNTDCIASLKY